MELYEVVGPLDDDERRERRDALERELAQIEIRRRFLHERIDLLHAERLRRFGKLGDPGALGALAPHPTAAPRRRALFTGTGSVSDEPLGGLPDLRTLGDADLHELIRSLKSREDDVSLQRRILHARIDELADDRLP
jgi:hypothetical protein